MFGGDDSGEVVHDGAVGDGAFECGHDLIEVAGETAGTDADGVVRVFVLVGMLGGADLDIHSLEPPGSDGVEGVVVGAVGDEVVVPGGDGVFEDEGWVVELVEEVDGGVDEVEVDGESVEGLTGGGVGDDGSTGDDDGVGATDGVERGGGFDETTAGADDDTEATVAGGVERGDVARGDTTGGVEEGAVEIDGEESVHRGEDGRWSKKEKSPMRFTSRGSSVGDDLLSRGAVSSAEKA